LEKKSCTQIVPHIWDFASVEFGLGHQLRKEKSFAMPSVYVSVKNIMNDLTPHNNSFHLMLCDMRCEQKINYPKRGSGFEHA